MQRQIKQVEEFHKAMEQPVLLTPQFPSIDRIELRCNLVTEECRELVAGMRSDDKDLSEVADAICDSIYVILGTAIEFGLQSKLVEMFDEVQRSNMSKLDENGRPVKRITDGKVMKSDRFSPPDLKSIINK